MKTIILGLGVLSIIGAASPAFAKDDYWYVGVKGGYVWDHNEKFRLYGTSIPSFELYKKHGYAVTGQIGYDFGRIRVELDSGFARTVVRGATLTNIAEPYAPGRYDADGYQHIYSALGNVLFDVVNLDKITVSAGGGFGFVRVNQRNIAVTPGGPLINDSENGYAWQLLGGARYALTDRLDLTADYRYFQTANIEYQTAAGGDVRARHKSQTAMIGFAYNFGGEKKTPVAAEAPPMPAPPPPAPPPPPVVVEVPTAPAPGPILVFFDFNSAVLSSAALPILDKTVNRINAGMATQLAVDGYADRSGSDAYNLKLGERRAEAVKNYLVAHGLSANMMHVTSYGEEKPLVATADGVREPQNRRVEIIVTKP